MEDFILSGELFCGHCLTPMTGTSGTGKSGKLHSYYKEKAKGCKNLTVKKGKIDRLEREAAASEQQAAAEEDRHYGLSEVDIMYFLSHLKKGDTGDPEHKKLLDEVREHNRGGSYASLLSPPNRSNPNTAPFFIGDVFGFVVWLSET